MWPDRNYYVGHTKPVLALPGIHSPVRLCPVLSVSGTLIGPARPCLALSCFILPYTVLSDLSSPVWRCYSLPCPTLLWLALPGLTLSGTVLPISIQSCPALSGLSGPAWHCSALSGPAQSCLTLSGPVWPYLIFLGPALSGVCSVPPCSALRGPVWRCPDLSCPAAPVRHCPALSGVHRWC